MTKQYRTATYITDYLERQDVGAVTKNWNFEKKVAKWFIVRKVLEYIFDIFQTDDYILTEDRSKNSTFAGGLVAVKTGVVKCKLPMLS